MFVKFISLCLKLPDCMAKIHERVWSGVKTKFKIVTTLTATSSLATLKDVVKNNGSLSFLGTARIRQSICNKYTYFVLTH